MEADFCSEFSLPFQATRDLDHVTKQPTDGKKTELGIMLGPTARQRKSYFAENSETNTLMGETWCK